MRSLLVMRLSCYPPQTHALQHSYPDGRSSSMCALKQMSRCVLVLCCFFWFVVVFDCGKNETIFVVPSLHYCYIYVQL